jgi:hypothetical protein
MGSRLPLFSPKWRVFAGTPFDIADDVRGNDMRKYLASLVFAGCGLIAMPAPAAAAPTADEAHAVAAAPVAAPVAVQQVRMPFGLRDEAAMVLVGTALIGLAAAVRRSA